MKYVVFVHSDSLEQMKKDVAAGKYPDIEPTTPVKADDGLSPSSKTGKYVLQDGRVVMKCGVRFTHDGKDYNHKNVDEAIRDGLVKEDTKIDYILRKRLTRKKEAVATSATPSGPCTINSWTINWSEEDSVAARSGAVLDTTVESVTAHTDERYQPSEAEYADATRRCGGLSLGDMLRAGPIARPEPTPSSDQVAAWSARLRTALAQEAQAPSPPRYRPRN